MGASTLYELPARITADDGGLRARLDGGDGRTGWLTTRGWAAPNLHLPFLRAFVATTGLGTRRRSSLVARQCQLSYRGFLQFFSTELGDDVSLGGIGPEHIRAYREHLKDSPTLAMRMTDLRVLTKALHDLGLCDRDLFEAASDAIPARRHSPQPGYDPETFASITAAATRDVEAITRRIADGEELLRRFRDRSQGLSEHERIVGRMLEEMADTGRPPRLRTAHMRAVVPMIDLARMLFLTVRDLEPLLVLLAIRTGRNVETLKELTGEHRIRESSVLETQTIKRRRGYESETVLWDIGSAKRQLKTAGGMYLLLHRLGRRSRDLARSDKLLCIFLQRNGGSHRFVWENRLNNVAGPDLGAWARSHNLTEGGAALRLTFNRIKTTVDRERAQANNFQLDRAAVTNTPEVLYRSYIAPDPTARRALESITNGALLDLDARLTAERSPEKTAPISQRPEAPDVPDAITTAFMRCRDVLGNPEQPGVECNADMLACFGCPCAVVGDEHIPTILRLSAELIEHFERLPLEQWIARFGQAWLAIHNDILPSRTTEEIAHFATLMPTHTALKILEKPEMF